MSRSKEYQRLLNSKRWRELRATYLRAHPLCERCIEEGEAAGIPGGYITSAVDVHHITPVETAKSSIEMERLCYDPTNLRALCIPCHVKTHKEMGKSTRANHIQRTNQALQRWIDKNTPKP